MASSQTAIRRTHHHLISHLSKSHPSPSSLLRFTLPTTASSSRRHASSKAPQTDKSRILEKPTKFNPPSHPSRRARPPRNYPGPQYHQTDAERDAAATKRYPNMMPPEGTFMHWFLHERKLHLWITLSTLVVLTVYTWVAEFVHRTDFADELPAAADFWRHPLLSAGQWLRVYRRHTELESEKAAQKRAMKIDDARKRKEFLREHGVEPGFLTGTWMDKFGTEEGDRWAKAREERGKQILEEQKGAGKDIRAEGREQVAVQAVLDAAAEERRLEGGEGAEAQEILREPREQKRTKRWLGLW